MKHHIYALIDPRTCQPFYIGKGTSARRFNHFKSAPIDARQNPDKVAVFDAIKKAGLVPQAIILSWHETQEEAYEAEKNMIDAVDIENLTNKNVGGAGGMLKTSNVEKEKSQRLTDKMEKFAQGVAKGLTYSDAYRAAYDASKSTDKSCNEISSTLMADIKISSRVDELKAPVVAELRKKLMITRESLLQDLEDAKDAASSTDQIGAVVGAIREQGKMLDIYPAVKRENKNTNVDLVERINKGRERVAKLRLAVDNGE